MIRVPARAPILAGSRMGAMATIRRSIVLDAGADRVWMEVNKPRLLIEVARPLIRFIPSKTLALDLAWEANDHQVRMLLFGFIPTGRHCYRSAARGRSDQIPA
ncbi:hypothetical protein BQ8482_360142 [Mesorhizobium delmotii]|uniref:Uncharacterized protein n=2 Tax=Mesorhizobium delmotii TaxID=1631247 RepID=A0A2P9ARE3_9HYPH|nr:hypothetical protein BQ8482_360142 [Mesorhizobium delmotii]